MDSLYKRHALPGFDDKFGEEKSIDQVTEDLTKLFQNTQRLVKNISHHGGSHQSDVLGKNIQNSLASRLQELSTKFRKSQSKYLKKLRKRETQGAATNFATNEEDADEDAVFTDAQMAVVASNENAITQREKEINEIAKSIMAVAEIFQELQTMVIDQGTVLDRIDYNIEQTNVALESAHEELLKVMIK
ncbi:hypothetical protein HDV02_006470 [Globomyces sp. JEL0801]|nr:hypothetical protein HDV02_006470 [Globomyces sp. JEL0801]